MDSSVENFRKWWKIYSDQRLKTQRCSVYKDVKQGKAENPHIGVNIESIDQLINQPFQLYLYQLYYTSSW